MSRATPRILAVLVVFGFLFGGCSDSADPDRPQASGPGVGDRLEGSSEGWWPLVTDTVGFTADGATVLGDCGGHLCRWDATTGGQARVSGVAGPELSDDGALALVPSANRVLVVDTASAEVTAVFDDHELVPGTLPSISALALSPDATLAVSVGLDQRAYLWHTEDGSRVRLLETGEADVARPLFSPDGRLMALAFTRGRGEEAVQSRWILDVATGEVVQELEDLARFHAWSPDGAWLVGTDRSGELAVWETEGYTRVAAGGLRSNGPAAVSPDSTTLAFVDRSDPTAIRLWRLGSDAEPRTIATKHPDPITALAWSPEGTRLASASTEATGEPAQTPAAPRDLVVVHDVADPDRAVRLTLPTR